MTDENSDLKVWLSDVLNSCHETGMVLPYIVAGTSPNGSVIVVRMDGENVEVLAEHYEDEGFRRPMTITVIDQKMKPSGHGHTRPKSSVPLTAAEPRFKLAKNAKGNRRAEMRLARNGINIGFHGGNVLMRAAYKTPAFLALAARERMSFTIAVPAIYTLCVNEPDFASHDLSAWRVGCFGGAPMPVATIKALAERIPGLTLINSYGATETTSPTALMPPGKNLEHLDSVGKVVPCGEVVGSIDTVIDQSTRRVIEWPDAIEHD
jgi:hypothetical protein